VPLHRAVLVGNLEIVKILIKFYAEVNSCDCEGKSPLHYACDIGDYKIVEILVNNKAIVNHCDEFGNSALHLACHNMHVPVIMYLGNAGIQLDVTLLNDDKQTPLACLNARAKATNKQKECEDIA